MARLSVNGASGVAFELTFIRTGGLNSRFIDTNEIRGIHFKETGMGSGWFSDFNFLGTAVAHLENVSDTGASNPYLRQ